MTNTTRKTYISKERDDETIHNMGYGEFAAWGALLAMGLITEQELIRELKGDFFYIVDIKDSNGLNGRALEYQRQFESGNYDELIQDMINAGVNVMYK